MTIPPSYTITNTILSYLAKIESNKTYLQTLSIPEKIITNLTRQSLLKSSVFSAQIEGNTLTPEDIEQINKEETDQYERLEIENIITALSYVRDKGIPEVIDIPFLLQLHRLIMHNLVHASQAGKFRTEPSAIFDSNGNVVYMTPPPSEINTHIVALLQLIDTQTIFPLIKAPLMHMAFEKIHPFTDGNGRVGRLVFQTILARHDYHFNWLLSIEELLQAKKQTYYSLLDQQDGTEFIEFILGIMVEESEKLRKHIANTSLPSRENLLLPRRKEILAIIKDHQSVSLDQIQRRFLKVPARTLRYDMKQLEKEGFITKIGTTRGAMYRITSNL